MLKIRKKNLKVVWIILISLVTFSMIIALIAPIFIS